MPEKMYKIYKADITSVDVENYTVDATISTEAPDRDGEIVLAEGIQKRLAEYEKHPVLLSCHNWQDLQKNIGQTETVKIQDGNTKATFQYFAGKGNEEADWGFQLAQEGIAAYSIGFIPHEWRDPDETEKKAGIQRVYTDMELLEISQVIVPSNRDALQVRQKMAGIEAELCEKTMANENLAPHLIEKKKGTDVPQSKIVEDGIDEGDAGGRKHVSKANIGRCSGIELPWSVSTPTDEKWFSKADSERPCSACSLPSRSLHRGIVEIRGDTEIAEGHFHYFMLSKDSNDVIAGGTIDTINEDGGELYYDDEGHHCHLIVSREGSSTVKDRLLMTAEMRDHTHGIWAFKGLSTAGDNSAGVAVSNFPTGVSINADDNKQVIIEESITAVEDETSAGVAVSNFPEDNPEPVTAIDDEIYTKLRETFQRSREILGI